MTTLNREKLLSKQKLEVEKVKLGKEETIYVREMTGRERDRFESSVLKRVKRGRGQVEYEASLEDFRAKLATTTVCDKDGELLLKPEDYKVLSQNMGASRLDKITTAAQRLNKISAEDREEMLKN